VALEVAKDPIVTLRHAKPPHQPLGRATANGVSDQTRQLCHPAGLPRIGFDHLVGLISKGSVANFSGGRDRFREFGSLYAASE
jgi:hypothetical protein